MYIFTCADKHIRLYLCIDGGNNLRQTTCVPNICIRSEGKVTSHDLTRVPSMRLINQ